MKKNQGLIAQLVERCVRNAEVGSSNLPKSTTYHGKKRNYRKTQQSTYEA